MQAFRDVYESMPATLTVPEHFRNRRVEVILLMLDVELPQDLTEQLESEATFPLADADIEDFLSAMPDFPDLGAESEPRQRPDAE